MPRYALRAVASPNPLWQVLDSMVYSMGITKHDVRHTVSTLRDYGNISSGAFLLAFERLQKEACVKRGDFGMFVTMYVGALPFLPLQPWPTSPAPLGCPFILAAPSFRRVANRPLPLHKRGLTFAPRGPSQGAGCGYGVLSVQSRRRHGGVRRSENLVHTFSQGRTVFFLSHLLTFSRA